MSTVPYSPAAPALRNDDQSPLGVVSILEIMLRRRRLILAMTLGATILALLFAFLRPLPYVARSRLMPTQGGGESDLVGLAAQFGLDPRQLRESESLEFYVELVRSQDLLAELATTRFEPLRPGGPTTWLELLDVDGETPQDRLTRTVEKLRADFVKVSLFKQAGLVQITTVAPTREWAEAMNRRIISLVSDFNLNRRQSNAAAERRFIEERIDAARAEYLQAEQVLRRFLEENRVIDNSPTLRFERERLTREVELKSDVYTNLVQAFEEARIEEVRNIPVVTVIDRPEGSASESPRNAAVIAIAGLLLGLATSTGAAVALERARGARLDGGRYPEVYRFYERLRRRQARGSGR